MFSRKDFIAVILPLDLFTPLHLSSGQSAETAHIKIHIWTGFSSNEVLAACGRFF